MSHDYGRILRAIVASPLAAEQAQCALVYSGAGDIELMALHAAACADIICEPTRPSATRSTWRASSRPPSSSTRSPRTAGPG